MRSTARLPRDLGLFLAGTLLLGVGQQLFVVLRNPWLVAGGWSPAQIPAVQATSAGAGVVAGFIGAAAAGRVSPSTLLVAAGLIQAAGFALQLAAPGAHGVVFAGALVAGFAIQLNTAVTPPYLKSVTAPPDRVAAFSATSIALFALAGLVGVAVVSLAHTIDTPVAPETLALLVGAVASALAALPFLRTRATPSAPRPARWLRLPPGAAPIALIHALIALAGGITVPILQLWFSLVYDTPPSAVAGIYATTMIVSAAGHGGAPRLARRLGLWQSVVCLQLAAVPLLLTMAGSTVLAVAAGAFLLRHVTNGMGMSLLHLLGQEVVAEGDGAALASLTVLVSSAAWALGSGLAGPLLHAADNRFGLVFSASIGVQVIAVVASVALLPRSWRGRPVAAGPL